MSRGIRGFRPSDMSILTSTGFKTKDYDYEQMKKRYKGYKSVCIKCNHSCKQWDCDTLIIKYCPKMDGR